MDDNLELDSSDPSVLGGQMTTCDMNQSDLLNNQMANQQVPGYHDDYHGDQIDDGHMYTQNQSSFSPSFVGKEILDSSLSDTNRGYDDEDNMLVDESYEDESSLEGSGNPFQPDLLKVNEFSKESNKTHSDDLLDPNDLSEKPSAQSDHEECLQPSQPPDLLMTDVSASRPEFMDHDQIKHPNETELKSYDDSDFQSQNKLQESEEAIENDFYNEGDENYDDEYVDSEESEYSDESDGGDKGENGLEHIVPEIKNEVEKPPGQERSDTENVLDNVDPNIGASGFSQIEEAFTKNVQYDETEEQEELSDEENEEISQDKCQAFDPSTSDFDPLRQNVTEAVISEVMASNLNNSNPMTVVKNEKEDAIEKVPSQNQLEIASEKVTDNSEDLQSSEIAQGVPKSSTFTIESDDSDLEERSLTPDPNQLAKMNGGSQFQTFGGDQKADQVQISGLVEGTLMEESENSDDEEFDSQPVPEEKNITDLNLLTDDQQGDSISQTEPSAVDQTDVPIVTGQTIQEKYEEEEMEDTLPVTQKQTAVSMGTEIDDYPGRESLVMGFQQAALEATESKKQELQNDTIETYAVDDKDTNNIVQDHSFHNVNPEQSEDEMDEGEQNSNALMDSNFDEPEVQNHITDNDQHSNNLDLLDANTECHVLKPEDEVVDVMPQSNELDILSPKLVEGHSVTTKDELACIEPQSNDLDLMGTKTDDFEVQGQQLDSYAHGVLQSSDTNVSNADIEDSKCQGQVIDTHDEMIEENLLPNEVDLMRANVEEALGQGQELTPADEMTDREPEPTILNVVKPEPEVQVDDFESEDEMINDGIQSNETDLMGSNMDDVQGQDQGQMYDSEDSEEEKIENEIQEKDIIEPHILQEDQLQNLEKESDSYDKHDMTCDNISHGDSVVNTDLNVMDHKDVSGSLDSTDMKALDHKDAFENLDEISKQPVDEAHAPTSQLAEPMEPVANLMPGQLEEEEDDDLTQGSMSQEDQMPEQMRESGMEGSFVLDEGETFDDKNFDEDDGEYVQSTPESSPEVEIPANPIQGTAVEGLEDGQSFDNKKDEEGQSIPDQYAQDSSPDVDITEDQKRETGMEGSFILDEGETLEDKTFGLEEESSEFIQSTPEISPEDELPSGKKVESGMEGSLVLDEGQTFDDDKIAGGVQEQLTSEVSPEDEIPTNQRESGMEGSFVLEEGETFDNKNFGDAEGEFEQSTPEVSPEDEIPPMEKRESGMEGSFVLEEGETFDDKNFGEVEEEFEQSTPEISPEDEVPPAEKRESGMEGSFVLEEGETFNDKKFGEVEGEFEQSTPEISPEDEVPTEQMRESGMEGSFVLEEGETFGDDKFGGVEEEFEQSTPEISPEQELPIDGVQEQVSKPMIPQTELALIMDEEKQVNGIDKDVLQYSQSLPQVNGQIEDETISDKVELKTIDVQTDVVEKQEVEGTADVQSPETPSDSYGEIDSAIQSPLSQDDMVQSPASEDMYVEQENQKNLMSSSLVDESTDQSETIETYQPCLQNGISHSASEEATPDNDDVAHPFQNGISHSASDESPEKEETKAGFNLIESEKQAEVSPDESTEKKESVKILQEKEVKKDIDNKTTSSLKKIEKTTTKKTTKFAKTDTIKKDVTSETKKDKTLKKDTKLPSTKTTTEKRSFSTSRVSSATSSRTTKPTTTRSSRDTTRKSKPETTTDTKPAPTKSRPKSIDISRTSSLTRPTMSSLNKARDRTSVERTPSPTKPMRNIPKTGPSRYRITKSKKDGSSDSGVEDDKSPKKADTQTKSQDGKVTPRSTSAKRSTIPTMNRSQPTKSEGSPKKTTAGKTPTPTKTTGSRIGSLDNARHVPGGGQVKIQSAKKDYSNVGSRIGSKDMITHKPAGGDKKILSQKLEWKAESKVGSLKNATHSPGGGKVKIQSEKLTWNAQSRVGSLDNANHSPGGGHVKITNEKINWKAESRVGSMDNAGYVPGGGNVHIPSEKIDWKAEPKVSSLENAGYVPGGGNVKIHDQSINWMSEPKVDSLSNSHYTPGGGNVKIQEEKLIWSARSKINSLDSQQHTARGGTHRFEIPIENKKLDFKDKAQSKVGSKDKITHKAGGGDKKIETQKLTFKEQARSKVGSKDYLDHKPGGGDKKPGQVGIRQEIDTQKLSFKESAKARTDSGAANGKSRPDSGIECEKTQASV